LKEETMNDNRDNPQARPTPGETAARAFFLVACGVLLSILVSCACGPIR